MNVIEYAILACYENIPGMSIPMIKQHVPAARVWHVGTLEECGLVARRKDDPGIIEITPAGREAYAQQKSIITEHPALTALRNLRVDELGPLEALTKLMELKRMVSK